ncbi:MAG: metalloregulator ArsR/SmtB family transcription factor [Acidobacteriia bacterium]|nr:metalloregulator ArsR/SmtB family transcription factor [Terriglobia bacterium]
MVEQSKSLLDGVFGAIADPTRRAILRQLGRSPARVTDIAKKFPVSLNAVSKHLIVLQQAGLVRREVRGRDHVCSLNAQPLREASAWIEETRAFWEERLDALERHLTDKRRRRQ